MKMFSTHTFHLHIDSNFHGPYNIRFSYSLIRKLDRVVGTEIMCELIGTSTHAMSHLNTKSKITIESGVFVPLI